MLCHRKVEEDLRLERDSTAFNGILRTPSLPPRTLLDSRQSWVWSNRAQRFSSDLALRG